MRCTRGRRRACRATRSSMTWRRWTPSSSGRRTEMAESADKTTRAIRRAAMVGGLGLVVQLAAALHWTPVTFILSAAVGAPLVLAGGVMFLVGVWRNMRDKGAV